MSESAPYREQQMTPAALPRTISALAWGGGTLVALLVPLVFLAIGYHREAAGLEAAARIGVRVAEAAAPGHGAGQQAQQILAAVDSFGGTVAIRVLDAQGSPIAQTDRPLPPPLLTRAASIRHVGEPAWRLELSRSLRPLLEYGALMGLPALLLGWAVFAALKVLPMRAFRLAVQEIAIRKETEAHLERSLSLFSATLESTTDGIFAADRSGRTIVSNERFLEMWNLSRSGRFGGSQIEALAILAGQLVDPAGFIAKQRELTRTAEDEYSEILHLRDGRVFEWHSRPQRVSGAPVGRVSSFRDISERFRAEALLAAEKEVLQKVVSGAALSEALTVLARHVEAQARHMFCAILFREGDGEGSLRYATGPSLSHAVERDVSHRSVEALVTVFAHAEHRQPAVGALWEIAAEPPWTGYRRIMADWGVEPRFAVPIHAAAGQLLGLVVAHYRVAEERQAHDTEVLRVAANLTGIAIERRQAEARLDIMAHYDALTRLPNRVLFRDRLEHALARADRQRELVALLFLDLDRFKTINDTLGHDAGDLLLQEVARRLVRCVRSEDTIARLGGDEFTLILEGVAKVEDAGAVAGKILEALAPVVPLGGEEAFVTPSIGITIYPFDGDSLEALLKNADTAMYQAKQGGGNSYQFFAPGMNTRTIARLQMESALRRALERGEFAVHYQPKVALDSGRIVGAEALLRWQHPDWGPVPPGEFIPILEETGMIEAVGEWVMRSVCDQNQAWLAAGLPPLAIAVNLSGRQLQRNNLAALVAELLEQTGMNPALLELEVTESMLMQDPEYAADMLAQIRAKGIVSIDVDDFGTGYSSLSYLKRFPIDALKIDKSFVQGLPDDEEDAAITRAVIALGHSLKLKVIAEGVETPAQLAFLRAAGCDVIQGYVIGRPMPADEFIRRVAEHRPEQCVRGATAPRRASRLPGSCDDAVAPGRPPGSGGRVPA